MKLLKFIPLILIVIACSKKSDEVTPALKEADLIGTWKLESVNGSITIDGKKQTYTDANSDNVILAYDEYIFKANGVGEFDGSDFTYKVEGNKISIKDDSDITLALNAKIVNKKLILSGDKTTFAPVILLFQAFGGNKITQWDETATYVKK